MKRDRAQTQIDEQVAAEKTAADQRVQHATEAVAQANAQMLDLITGHNEKLHAIQKAADDAMAITVREHNEALEQAQYSYNQSHEKLMADHEAKVLDIQGKLGLETIARKTKELNDQLNLEDTHYNDSLDKLDASVDKQIRHAQREHDEKSAALVVALDKD